MATSAYSRIVAAEFNRPADTTAYTAKDAIANATSSASVLIFPNITPEVSQFGYLVKARLITNKASWASTNAAVFKLHLYSEPITAFNDNAQANLVYSNRARRIGMITFSALQTEGSGSDMASALWTGALAFMSKTTTLNSITSNTTIYGILQVDSFTGALTPDSGQSFFIELTADCF